MKVILNNDVKGLGKGGDLVEVKDGYARNYLIPQGIVLPATDKGIRRVKHEQQMIANRLKKERGSAEDIALRLSSISCTIAKRVGENNRLFGSVTSKDIEEALREEGLLISRKQILLDDSIRELGVYEVSIKLHTEVTATLKVWVVAK